MVAEVVKKAVPLYAKGLWIIAVRPSIPIRPIWRPDPRQNDFVGQ